MPTSTPQSRVARSALAERFAHVRARTLELAAPLSEADCQVQSMPDASPTKWHLAHVTWFFETFILERFERHFKPFHPQFRVLYNSYYQQVGAQHPRPQRGLVTRPSLAEVKNYRAAVDERVLALLSRPHDTELQRLVELGLQHEQQHQELLLTDILHALSCNPMAPLYKPGWPLAPVSPVAHDWCLFEGGLIELGHEGPGFAFDNEGPRHSAFVQPYALGHRLVTHGEWQDFVRSGGYADSRWWLAAGWDWRRAQGIETPLYWHRSSDGAADWHVFTLHGLVPLDPHTPIVHVSYFEADAYARWAALQLSEPIRLPTEAEWEHAAQTEAPARIAAGNFADSGALHPMPLAGVGQRPMQMFGDVWEWTSSSYAAYPGYRPWTGAVGEYNGKFMVNQYVLRGGSCATPRDHIRASYRNFFPTDARWQFSGVRLACDIYSHR